MIKKIKKRKDNTKKPLGCGCFSFFGLIALMLLGLILLFNVVDYIEGVTNEWEKEEGQQTKTVTDPIAANTVNIPKEKVREKTVKPIKEKKETESCQATIKGNISSSGEKIYHVPGGDFYDTTVAEEKFCSSVEAVASGYRKSKR